MIKTVYDYVKLVSNCFKTRKICNKAVDNYSSTMQFVSDWYNTQEISEKTIDICSFAFDSVPDQ